MNLHRSGRQPEWEIETRPLNPFQKLAKLTNGVVTPGNAISLTGAELFRQGMIDLRKGKKIRAIGKVVASRLCDLGDGAGANATRTKSPLGEGVDVIIDKAEAAIGLPILVKEGVVPAKAAVGMGVMHIANTALTVMAKIQGNEIHPTKSGKLGTGVQWSALLAYGLGHVTSNQEHVGENFDRLGHTLTGASLVLGVMAVVDYVHDAFAKAPGETIELTLEA